MKHNVKKDSFEFNRTVLLKMNWKIHKNSLLIFLIYLHGFLRTNHKLEKMQCSLIAGVSLILGFKPLHCDCLNPGCDI